MKLIIAGGRNLRTDDDFINECLFMFNIKENVEEVISGTARGADRAGEDWALNLAQEDMPVIKFPADWDEYGKAAGHIRNKEMAEYADALLLIWDGESRGSANMKKEMKKLGKPIYEVILTKDE